MHTLDFGDITIQRVIELDRWMFPAQSLIPAMTDEFVTQSKKWLDNRFIDEQTNQLVLHVHSYVVRTKNKIILVDTCNGNHKERPNLLPHHQLNTNYIANLAAIGLRAEDIDLVMCTHLHPDHCGWNTLLADGRWVPTFPNARYLMSRLDLEFITSIKQSIPSDGVMQDLVRMFDDSVLPVVQSGQAEFVETDHVVERELGAGIWMEGTPGHTPGSFAVHVENRQGHAIMVGDTIHHPIQLAALDLDYIGDANAEESRSIRRRIVEQYADSSTYFLTGHFPTPTFGHVISQNNGFRFRWLADR